jgi:hypothetical protein
MPKIHFFRKKLRFAKSLQRICQRQTGPRNITWYSVTWGKMMRFACQIITRTLRTNVDSQPFIFIALDLVETLSLRCMFDLPTVILFDKYYSLLDYNYIVIWRHLFSPIAQQSLEGQNLLYEYSRSLSDTPHSIGLLWTSDGPVAENFTWQHTTFTRDKHPCSGRDSKPQFRQASGCRPKP